MCVGMPRSVASRITDDDLSLVVSRSSGPGGQNVNKVNTRVMLYFDVAQSTAFSESEKRLILSRLRTRCDKQGVLRVISQKHRTQGANRQAAYERLIELLEGALDRPKPRVATRPTRGSQQRRLEHKRQRSQLKQQRSQRDWSE